jgi:hypothetical protein
VKLYSRPGNDLTKRFPLIVKALARLRARRPATSTARRCAATTRSVDHLFRGGGSATESSLSGLADMVRSCGIVESPGLPPDTWLLPDIPERAISYAYMTSQAWRLPVPHIQAAS